MSISVVPLLLSQYKLYAVISELPVAIPVKEPQDRVISVSVLDITEIGPI